MRKVTLIRGMIWGLIGGLAGTLAMDLVLVGVFLLLGMPADLTFSFIGDTAARFFTMIGIDIAGGVPLGAAIHYLIGLVLGGLFGGAVSQVAALRVDTLKRGIIFGVLYIESISLPILVTAPLINTMTASDTLQWFGLSFPMHLICGVVLGVVVSYGLRSATTAQHG